MGERPDEPEPPAEPKDPPPDYNPDRELIDTFKKSGDPEELEHR